LGGLAIQRKKLAWQKNEVYFSHDRKERENWAGLGRVVIQTPTFLKDGLEKSRTPGKVV